MTFLILPFLLPALLIAEIVGFTSLAIWSDSDKGEISRLSICALGPNQSGKTLFFNKLRRKHSATTQQTSRDEINEFTVTLSNGKSITFAKTVDFNGAPTWIKGHYRSIIQGKNRVFFFCNIYAYLNDVNYERDVNSRLDIIKDIMSEYKMTTDCFYIILSYADKCKNPNESKRLFQTKIGTKSNYGVFSSRVYDVIDMTNSYALDKLINNLFS